MSCPDKGRLTVVMPVYNEEKTLAEVIRRVLAQELVGELVAVNDASRDNSREVLRQFESDPRVKVLDQEKNCGKGAALIRGFAAASKEFVIVQDADFEYDPADYAAVLQPLLSGKADMVYGSRFMNTPGQVRFFRHEMGNKILTFFSNFFSNLHLSDMETCYKAFRRKVVANLKLTSRRFGIEVEITAKLARGKHLLRIWEVPVSYSPRSYTEGKKITWRDGVAAFWHIVRFNCFTPDRECMKQSWESLMASPEEVQ